MAKYWAEFEIGLSGRDGSRYENMNDIRKDAIREYNSSLRVDKAVKIFLTNDQAYQTYRNGKGLWKRELRYYGLLYKDKGNYILVANGNVYKVFPSGSIKSIEPSRSAKRTKGQGNQMGLDWNIGEKL